MSKYNIGVWDIQFYKTDDDGNEASKPTIQIIKPKMKGEDDDGL